MSAEPAEPIFDRPEQLDHVKRGLMPAENIIAVYDAIGAGTGFIGLTDQRVVIQDNSFVGKRVAITSIPYSRITSVSLVSNKSILGSFFSSGTIAVHVGAQTYEVSFRGDQKSHHVPAVHHQPFGAPGSAAVAPYPPVRARQRSTRQGCPGPTA